MSKPGSKDVLRQYAALPAPNWLSSLTPHIDSAQLLAEFLTLDLQQTSEPSLPPTILTAPVHRLTDPILLQIAEIVDITLPLTQRANFEISKTPTFKLLLSDGFTHYIGLTCGMFPQLSPLLMPGVKILVRSGTTIRFGVFLFNSSQNAELIGGHSDILFDKCRSNLIFDPNAETQPPPPDPAAAKPRPGPTLKLVAEEGQKRRPVFLHSDSDDQAAADFDFDLDFGAETEARSWWRRKKYEEIWEGLAARAWRARRLTGTVLEIGLVSLEATALRSAAKRKKYEEILEGLAARAWRARR
jgi:hypothetical protein